jgi:hypothetical protein
MVAGVVALKIAERESLARRFESWKSGRSGYQPDCANEWVRGVCEKPRIKCTDCPHQRFRPVTDAVVTWHLQGHDDAGAPFVMGVYPMLRDETCFFSPPLPSCALLCAVAPSASASLLSRNPMMMSLLQRGQA